MSALIHRRKLWKSPLTYGGTAVFICLGLWVLRPKPETVTDVSPAPTNQVVALGRLEPAGGVIKLSVPNAADSRVNQILVSEGNR